MLKTEKTDRGFKCAKFRDRYDKPCSIQESSLATESCLWLGVEDYRMHLTQDMASRLIPFLEEFIKNGHL